ncbi:MAG TPA: type II toxin-antitoxin system RelE/ParE family toxin [Capsulimonadaceae bacterium]|jgi:plasmid stabilization system protein ParE
MAGNAPKLTVVYSQRALHTLDEIWEWNAERYSAQHAQSYTEFLKRRTEDLSSANNAGRIVPTRPGYRYVTILRRRGGHGHVAVYEIVDSTIYILNYYHTAQDWQGKLASGEW